MAEPSRLRLYASMPAEKPLQFMVMDLNVTLKQMETSIERNCCGSGGVTFAGKEVRGNSASTLPLKLACASLSFSILRFAFIL